MTDISDREKALIEAARNFLNAYGHAGSDLSDRLFKALEAYDPPKPDPDVLVVRAVLHAHQRAMTPPDSGWCDMSYEKGSYDDLDIFKAALAAYREARVMDWADKNTTCQANGSACRCGKRGVEILHCKKPFSEETMAATFKDMQRRYSRATQIEKGQE